ncbi:hypothetical protein K523DRAFT_418476 [Schizophyllum commune Tattone D]|nr:hypothetical protein K523DRAFT_418476 [Schizophyllum commune Tattone D]
MHIHSHYLHATASGHASAGQMYLATQGYHHGCEPYLLQGDDGTTYAIHPGDWPWWPFASGAEASAYAANPQYARIYAINPYLPPHASYQHVAAPAFVQYLPQYSEFFAPPAVATAPESYHPAHGLYQPAHGSAQLVHSVQPSTSDDDGLKAPKPKRPDEGVPTIIVEDEVPDIVVEDCDSSNVQPPGAGLASPATNSSDGTHLHPHWHERTESPSEGSLAPNPSHDSSVTSPSEGPLLYPRIHAIKSISCHCTPRVPLLKDISSSLTSSLASLTAHPSSPTASTASTASDAETAAGTSTATTAPNISTAPALTARPVSSPPVMTSVVVPMFPFSPLVPKVSLGSLRMPARSFKERLPLGFIPGVLSPWVMDGRGLSLQPLPAEGARGDSKLTLDSSPLPPYSPAPSMGSATSHWDGERLVSADQGGQRLAGDPWGHEEAVRRWIEELDEFCRTERCASKARWPSLAEVSKVRGDEAAKANDAANAKVDHAETVQLDDHTDLLDRIPWPILRDPDPFSLNTARSNLHDPRSSPPDLARSVTALTVNLFFRAARQVMLDDHAASRNTLNDRAADRDTPDNGAWCALLRKSHRASRRVKEVVEERLKQETEANLREMKRDVKMEDSGDVAGKEVHWKDEDDEVVVYMTSSDKRDESAKDGRDGEKQDGRCQKLGDNMRALNIVLQTLDVLRRLDGY